MDLNGTEKDIANLAETRETQVRENSTMEGILQSLLLFVMIIHGDGLSSLDSSQGESREKPYNLAWQSKILNVSRLPSLKTGCQGG